MPTHDGPPAVGTPPDMLRHALTLPGVTVNALKILQELEDRALPLDAASDCQLARFAACSPKTASRVRRWLTLHRLDPHGTAVSPCVPSVTQETEQNYSENTQVDTLVHNRLNAMGFMQLPNGLTWAQRPVRLRAWVGHYGARNILYAIWLAEGPKGAKRNRAGFVRTLVEGGQTAPDGWHYPGGSTPTPPRDEGTQTATDRLQRVECYERVGELEGRLHRDPLKRERARLNYTGQIHLQSVTLPALHAYRQHLEQLCASSP